MNPDRIAGLTRLLRTKSCSHILVSDTTDIGYISGFRATNAYLLISSGKRILLSDFRYQQAAEEFISRNPGWVFVPVTTSDFSFLKPLVPRGSALGVQSNVLSVDAHGRLRRTLRGASVVKLSGAVAALSVPKTHAEIRTIGRCAAMADKALAYTIARIKTGMTEKEAVRILEQRCRSLGSDGPAFDTIVLFGARTALPHGIPTSVRLRRGDLVLFDFGCTIDGLRSDLTRTVVMGKASPEQRKIYGVVRAAQRTARQGIKAGMRASSVDSLARHVIENAGYGNYFGHATGHGVGYRIHEEPRLSAANRSILKEATVVTVEPGIYIPGVGGVRIEDMVVLARGGARLLSHFPRTLMELDT
jgi:Xaa-Pro aminopeptidase